MKQLTFLLFIGSLILNASCENQAQKNTLPEVNSKQVENGKSDANIVDSMEKGSRIDHSTIEPAVKAKEPISEEYTITFAEWQDKSTNVTCIVIRQDSLFTILNDGSFSSSEKNTVIDSGILRIHVKTGKTILSKDPNDIYSPEIGGCSDGPIVVDLENKIIEFC